MKPSFPGGWIQAGVIAVPPGGHEAPRSTGRLPRMGPKAKKRKRL